MHSPRYTQESIGNNLGKREGEPATKYSKILKKTRCQSAACTLNCFRPGILCDRFEGADSLGKFSPCSPCGVREYGSRRRTNSALFPPPLPLRARTHNHSPQKQASTIWDGSVALVHTDIYGKVCWALRCMRAPAMKTSCRRISLHSWKHPCGNTRSLRTFGL